MAGGAGRVLGCPGLAVRDKARFVTAGKSLLGLAGRALASQGKADMARLDAAGFG